MGDFISLICPSCGGKLKVSANATSMTCQHCGNEHMVKRESGGAVMLEAYARCPVCGRNDRSEKVSAVIGSQSQEVSGTEKKTEVIVNAQGQRTVIEREVPFTRQQVSKLGQKLWPPAEPDPRQFPAWPIAPTAKGSGGWVSLLIVGILGLLIGCGLTIWGAGPILGSGFDLNISLGYWMLLCVGSIFVAASLAGLVFGVVKLATPKGVDPEIQKRYEARVREVRGEREWIVRSFEQATDRWRRLYYCSRDDCVYIPSENTSAPVENMMEYLYPPEPLPPPS